MLFLVINGNFSYGSKLNKIFNVSEGVFLFLSIFGDVVFLCKKGKLTTRIKCEKVS